ncbi:hypothetical protein [Limnohabitans sp. WS1]|uniref:hypothetical protein n=1 Tax=Limnohabitans sp. WS1 TaxID=1100726 RepID=UPI0011B1C6C5|nr:hypothetical protein [Limnohabitans sp. WS1]
MKNLLKFSALALSTTLLVACGGGGGTTTGSNGGGNTLSTAFIDAPVKGLTYISTPSGLTGTTDTAGTISYKEGDSVSLYLGGSSGLSLATFKPVTGSQVFVPTLPNYGSIVQILLSLDGAENSAAYMDVSAIRLVPDATKQALAEFLDFNKYELSILDSARVAIANNNTIQYKKNSSVSVVEANSHVDISASMVTSPPDNPLSATYNKAYFNYVKTLTGPNAGEILSGFFVQKDPLNFDSLSGDDGFVSFKNSTPMSITGSQAIIDGFQITDTFQNTQQSVSCPTRADFVSYTNGGNNYVQKVSQNTSGLGLCEKKDLMQYRYALSNTFTASSLRGKVITAKQSCGLNTNSIVISIDSSGNYSITGTICSLKQQGFTLNVRDILNPTVSNGAVADVVGFSGLIRLTPTGYDSVARAAKTPLMLLGKSLTENQLYFSISDGGAPGLLAGGFMKLESIN